MPIGLQYADLCIGSHHKPNPPINITLLIHKYIKICSILHNKLSIFQHHYQKLQLKIQNCSLTQHHKTFYRTELKIGSAYSYQRFCYIAYIYSAKSSWVHSFAGTIMAGLVEGDQSMFCIPRLCYIKMTC